MSIKVTIITVVKNDEKFILRTLYSIEKQNYNNIENVHIYNNAIYYNDDEVIELYIAAKNGIIGTRADNGIIYDSGHFTLLPMNDWGNKNDMVKITSTGITFDKICSSHGITNIDYLQIDLEADMGTTISTLDKLDKEVMDNYKFAVVTFEHDIYRTSNYNTRARSRDIFIKRGYYRVFDDINNTGDYPYEDWYVHPDLVDMNYIQNLQSRNQKHYRNIKIRRESDMRIQSINWQDIEYE
jgi:glycosyltransferase involved in cell wall biosynthesis